MERASSGRAGVAGRAALGTAGLVAVTIGAAFSTCWLAWTGAGAAAAAAVALAGRLIVQRPTVVVTVAAVALVAGGVRFALHRLRG